MPEAKCHGEDARSWSLDTPGGAKRSPCEIDARAAWAIALRGRGVARSTPNGCPAKGISRVVYTQKYEGVSMTWWWRADRRGRSRSTGGSSMFVRVGRGGSAVRQGRGAGTQC